MKATFYVAVTEDESSPEGRHQSICRNVTEARQAFRDLATPEGEASQPQWIEEIQVEGRGVREIAIAAASAVTICNHERSCGKIRVNRDVPVVRKGAVDQADC